MISGRKLAAFLAVGISGTCMGGLISFEPINEPLPYFDQRTNYESWDAAAKEKLPSGSAAVTTAVPRPFATPLQLQVTRSVFPAEDKTIDAILIIDDSVLPLRTHSLQVRLKNGNETVVDETLSPLEASQYFLSLRFPEAAAGAKLRLEASLIDKEGGKRATASQDVEVAKPDLPPADPSIDIHVDKPAPGQPCRIGVPLPRGLVEDVGDLVLVDSQGKTVPCDIQITGKWAKYGTVKWIFLTFLASSETRYQLRLGKGWISKAREPFQVGKSFLAAEVAKGMQDLARDVPESKGAGLVTNAFLRGGFVEHASGSNSVGGRDQNILSPGELYEVPENAKWTVESSSQSLIQFRCEDWFVANDSERFCRFVARLRVYPGSPFVDFEYTWIFTGDGNRDCVRSMGWKFGVKDFQPAGFIGAGPQHMLPGDALVQFDSSAFEVRSQETSTPYEGRSAGIALGRSGGNLVALGVRDFWENFPSELSVSSSGPTFFLWPQHGRKGTHDLTLKNAYKLWFAHEGEFLSFALPRALTEAPLYGALSGGEPPFAHGVPESVNAQGIAKTTEIRLYAGTDSTEEVVAAFQGWNARSNDAVVDPEWVAKTEVFPGIAAKVQGQHDWWEDDYERAAKWPHTVIEALDIYGKWIYGDLPMIGDIEQKTAGLYRAYEKAHWGWPYSWMPYARSGEPAFKKLAEAATRMMTDTAYCHFVSKEVELQFDKFPPRKQWASYQPFRAKGWNNEGLIPWAGGYWGPTSRMYCDKVDHIFDSWHLTGYSPGLEVAKDWMQQTKIEQPGRFGRGPIISDPIRARWTDNLLKQYVICYEETFDPWFICAARALAEMHLWMEKRYGWKGHFWQGGATEYLRYTRNPQYGEFYLCFAKDCLDPSLASFWTDVAPAIQPGVFAHEWSGDLWFLRRAGAFADQLHEMVRSKAVPADYQGWLATGGTNEAGLYYGWYLRWAPQLFGAWRKLGSIPDSIPGGFFVRATSGGYNSNKALLFPEISVRMGAGRSKKAIVLNCRGGGAGQARALLSRDGKQIKYVDLKDGVTEIPIEGENAAFKIQIVAAGEKTPPFTLRLPVCDYDVPEVYRLSDDGRLPASSGNVEIVYPAESGASVTLGMKQHKQYPVRRASLWSESGELLYDLQLLNRELTPREENFECGPIPPSVPKGLVKLSLPGSHDHVVVQRASSPWFSVSKEKWFEPEEKNSRAMAPSSTGDRNAYFKN